MKSTVRQVLVYLASIIILWPDAAKARIRSGCGKPHQCGHRARWPTVLPSPFDLFSRSLSSAEVTLLSLHVPAQVAGPLVPVSVFTRSSAILGFQIDVDLDHDGRLEGQGELSYAQGCFTADGSGKTRLHGLVPGLYQLRARAFLPGGREIATAPQEFELQPPQGNHRPVSFEPNRGQAESDVLFLGRAHDQMILVTQSETKFVRYVGFSKRSDHRVLDATERWVMTTRRSLQDDVCRFRLAGANPGAVPTGQKRLPGISNYFIGNRPSGWLTNIETYQEVVTRNVYPGIDLIYHSSQGRLEYDFRVAAGADPNSITLEFPDAESLTIDEDGGLVLRLGDGSELRKSAPALHQQQGGQRQAVKGDWLLKGRNRAGYIVPGYDPTRELVIDPIVFSTYLGGGGIDQGNAIALDAAGNTYVAGTTTSNNFSTTAGVIQPNSNGVAADAFILKLNPAGTTVLYSTYLGGGGPDFGNGIAVDAVGNAYVTGQVGSTNFPVTPGAFQTTPGGGGNDAFVAKLDPTGSNLLYSTYLGGTFIDTGNAIAIDAAGNAYVTGTTQSNTYPTTPGAFQTTFGGVLDDAFVTKINPTGSALLYSTFLGGPGFEDGFAIAVDGAGNAFVAGRTSSTTFPVTPGAFQATIGSPVSNAFVTKLNTTGSGLVYSTYLGGNGSVDKAAGIAVDAAGNAYVTGTTGSSNFPTTPGAFQTAFGGGWDAFVTKLNPAGNGLAYSTYLGTNFNEECNAIAIDAAGNAYVTGYGPSSAFPTVNPIGPAGGTNDVFATKINAAGTALAFSTLLGGSNNNDQGKGIAVDGSGNICVTGNTDSANFPVSNAVQTTYGGGLSDAFVVKLTPGGAPSPGVTIAESGGSTNVAEGGATDAYTMVLNTAPTATVTITINPGPQLSVTAANLVFTSANWNVPQGVTVTAVDDALVEGPHTGTISHTASSADPAYTGIAITSVITSITDNDVGSSLPGGIGQEGSGAGGASGNVGFEGSFGLGSRVKRTPRLRGPFWQAPQDACVLNVVPERANRIASLQQEPRIPSWGLAGAGLLLAVTILLAGSKSRRG